MERIVSKFSHKRCRFVYSSKSIAVVVAAAPGQACNDSFSVDL
jgi:hypothetical protein